jgi:hypothetical protein
MTGHGVSDSDMPTFPWPARPEADAFDALLAGHCRPEQTCAELRPVAEALMALQAPPDRREAAGWGEALTVYRQTAGRPGTRGRPRPRPSRAIAAPLGTRLAAAGAAAAIALLGGGAAAAYTGTLPAGLQEIAHRVLAAPAVRPALTSPTTSGTGRPRGPSATGSALGGLCNAYEHADASHRSVAFRNLAQAAGGSQKVTAYCASAQPSGGATGLPGRRVGPGARATAPAHGRKPTAPSGQDLKNSPDGNSTSDNGKGGGSGGGNGNGRGDG